MELKPGQHGSTYGGNPLACRIAIEALKVNRLIDDNVLLCDRVSAINRCWRKRSWRRSRTSWGSSCERSCPLCRRTLCRSCEERDYSTRLSSTKVRNFDTPLTHFKRCLVITGLRGYKLTYNWFILGQRVFYAEVFFILLQSSVRGTCACVCATTVCSPSRRTETRSASHRRSS